MTATTATTTNTTTATGLALALRDSRTMLRRNLRRMARYPSITIVIVGMPIVFLLLFVYVFGGTLGAGLGDPAGGRAEYLDYVTPGIIVVTMAGAAQGTALAIAMDMTSGIIARFRTMAVSRSAVLGGHVAASMIQTLGSMLVVLVVALVIGFSPDAGPVEWAAAAGLLVLATLAFTWLSVAFGLAAKSPETASNLPLLLVLLPFLGSGFVPTESMPAALRWFADNQPFSPIMETLRGLLLGTPIGSDGVLAVAWSVGIGLAAYVWARALFARPPVR
jgi:ABC-2 type transport system permease protein